MATFNAGAIEATLDLDIDPFQRGIAQARAEARKFAGEKYEAQIGVDTAGAMGQVNALRAQLEQVATGRYSPVVDLDGAAQTMAELNYIGAALDELGASHASPTVDLDGGAQVLAELQMLEARLNAFGRGRHVANVGADTSGFTSGIGGAHGALSGLLAAAALLGPTLIPGLVGATAAAGGLTAALMAAGGALAVLGAGVIGNIVSVIGAQKSLEQATTEVESAAKAAATAQAGAAAAARGVQTAEQNLANARRSAAQQVAAAESQLAAAQRNVKYAQDALNQARKDAAERLEDYRDQLRGAALDEEGAELAVRRAYQTLQAALADPNATKLDKDEARQAYQEALFNLDQVRESRDELQQQAKKDREAGVRGSDEVKAARDQLRQATEQLRAAEQAVTDARRNGAQQVAAAQQAVADAQRNASSAAAAAADANEKLQEAESKRAEALATLSTPAAQAFTAALDAAKDAWHEFLDATQDSALGVATRGLELFAKYLPDLAPVADAAAEAVGNLFDRLDRWLEGGGMDGIIDFLTDYGPGFIESFGIVVGNLARWFGGIAEAFAPFAEEMMRGLEDLTDGWADWANGLEDNPAFQDFIDYALEYGPLFLDTLGSILDGLIQVGKAVAPAGVIGLKVLRSVFDVIADMDPQTLAIVAGIAAGVIAMTTGSPIAGAIAIVALISAFSRLAGDSPALQSVLDSLGELLEVIADEAAIVAGIVKDDLAEAWRDIQPDLEELGRTISDDLVPAFRDFEPVLRAVAHVIGPVAEVAMRRFITMAKGIVKVLAGVMDFISGVFTGDWRRAWRGLLGIFTGVWDIVTALPRAVLETIFGDLGQVGGKIADRWHSLWSGIKSTAGDAADWLADHLWRGEDSLIGRMKRGFSTGIDAIADIWDGLRKAAGTPVKFVVDTVYNQGIVKVVNAIPGVSDIDPVDTSSWPSFATGGVLPGWTPGRDVHRFVSPTAGVLNLSGGEAVMRPEWTRAVGGPAAVDRMNAAAMRGDAGMGFFLGGVIPLSGGSVSAHGLPYYDTGATWAGDLNYPGYADYGEPIHAWKGGRVAGQIDMGDTSYGRYVVLDHGSQSSLYAHMSRFVPLNVGQTVAAGQVVGYVGDYGNTGNPPTSHLHFEVRGGGVNAGDFAGVGASGSGSSGGNFVTKFLGAVDAAKDFASDFPDWVDKLKDMTGWGPMMVDAAKSFGRSAAQYVNDKIPNRFLPDNPIPMSIFDQGGWLRPGGMAVNLGSTPEPVLTGDQWDALSRVALTGHGYGLTKADVDRIVKAIEDNRSVNVSAPDQATGAEVIELLAYELRK